MIVFETDDLGAEYKDLLKAVMHGGEVVAPRGMRIVEASPLVLRLSKPELCVTSRPGFSRRLMWLEIASILSGDFDHRLYRGVSPSAARLLSPQGAYGPRVSGQMQYVLDELRRDPASRRAVVYVGSEKDLRYSQSFEQPCTMTWQFLVRDGALRMVVSMRSWDLVWGLGYDVPSFVSVQAAVAQCIGVEVGEYVHVAGSGHIYDRHWDLEVVGENGAGLAVAGFAPPGADWRDVEARARDAARYMRGEPVVPVGAAWSQLAAAFGARDA